MKKVRRYFPIMVMLLATAVLFTSCKKDDDEDMDDMNQPKSIAAIASENSQFSTLVDALNKANLATTLDGNGTFTVFAPTNDAFSALFQELGVNGIDDLSADVLTPILLYHVVGSVAMSTDLSTGYFESLSASPEDGEGIILFIEADGGVTINSDITVINADIEASNGVIHAVDKVILPPTVVDIAIQNPDFSILVQAVVKAGLVDALSAEGPFTVFAPNNSAFEMLFQDLGISGIDDLTADDLTPILLYHVVSGNIRSDEVSSGSVPTLNEDDDIEIMVSNEGVKIDDANVIAVDVQGANGVIHVLDKVLLPDDDR
jgi:transforming growth factor-beta-induced protein